MWYIVFRKDITSQVVRNDLSSFHCLKMFIFSFQVSKGLGAKLMYIVDGFEKSKHLSILKVYVCFFFKVISKFYTTKRLFVH